MFSRLQRTSAACRIGTAAIAFLSAPLAAQTTFELEATRTEAWAMRWFAAVATPTGFGVAEAGPAWRLSIVLEGGLIPSLSEEERRVGFQGTKVEDLNRSPVFARPELRLSLPGDFSLAAGWVPPVELDGVEPNLVSLSLSRPLWKGPRGRIGARVFVLDGRIDGDITCPADEAAAGDDPVANPFDCEEASDDTVSIESVGVEAGYAFRTSDRTELFASMLWQELDAEFQVRARYADYTDRDRLVYSGDDIAWTAGLAFLPDERWRLAAELFYSPLDVVRGRVGFGREENDALFNVRLALSWHVN